MPGGQKFVDVIHSDAFRAPAGLRVPAGHLLHSPQDPPKLYVPGWHNRQGLSTAPPPYPGRQAHVSGDTSGEFKSCGRPAGPWPLGQA
jgi:hypothetical protein